MKHKKWLILGGCVLLVALAALAVILRERPNPGMRLHAAIQTPI